MKTMAAGEFKAKCLQVMDEVRSTRTPVVITKRGKPVAKLVPADQFRLSGFPDVWLGRSKYLETSCLPWCHGRIGRR